MKIAVSSDERTHLVDVVLNDLKNRAYDVIYFGPEIGATADWPIVTSQAMESLVTGQADEAIVMCWTGTGASIAANKYPGVRAALCSDKETAKGSRIWNHANVLALSLRTTSEAVVKEILETWFNTPFSMDEWNVKQVDRIKELDKKGT